MRSTHTTGRALHKKNPIATSSSGCVRERFGAYFSPWHKRTFFILGVIAVLASTGLLVGWSRAAAILPAAGDRGGLGYGSGSTTVNNTVSSGGGTFGGSTIQDGTLRFSGLPHCAEGQVLKTVSGAWACGDDSL